MVTNSDTQETGVKFSAVHLQSLGWFSNSGILNHRRNSCVYIFNKEVLISSCGIIGKCGEYWYVLILVTTSCNACPSDPPIVLNYIQVDLAVLIKSHMGFILKKDVLSWDWRYVFLLSKSE